MAADTDNADGLVSQLLTKLAALDSQVQLYRQNMAREFQQHSRDLLEDVPKDVAARVEQTVADSLHNYTALNPGFSDLAAQQQSEQIVDPIERIELDRRARAGSRSPPPVLPHTSGVPPEQSGPRSPHEREREFLGLFTPSYLPLLEAEPSRNASHKKNHQTSYTSTSTSIIPPASISPSSSSSPLPKPDRNVDHVESNHLEDTSNPSSSSLATLRPDPARRHTEETLSSVTSDDSTYRSRPRSALRRSSSSSTRTGTAQSPRRVRFEVEGGEVLPTASPMLSPRISDHPPSPLNSTDNIVGEFEQGPQLPPSLGDLNMDLPESDLLGSSPPRPKKVSSTDRLKAMTRNSTEDTSKWYTVGDMQGSDDEEDELVMGGGRSGRQPGTRTQAATPSQPAVTQTPVAHRTNDTRLPSQLSPGLPVVQERDETINSEEDEDSSDSDGALKMPARSKGSKGPIISKFSAPSPAAKTSTASSVQKTSTKPANEASDESHADEEDMFDFDEDGHGSPSAASKPRHSSKYIDEEEDHDDIEEPSTPTGNVPPANLSSSVKITRTPQTPKSPTSGITSGVTSGIAASMGSYKGRPFMIGSIKNEQLHQEASKMGNFTSFVGSVDGRTGVDEKSSYRPDGMSFKGTPKSLSERMMKEELEQEEAAQREEPVTS